MNDRMSIGLEDLAAFAVVFGIDVNWILTGRGNMIPKACIEELNQEENKLTILKKPLNDGESELVAELKETIAYLRKEVEELKDDKELLKRVIKNKL